MGSGWGNKGKGFRPWYLKVYAAIKLREDSKPSFKSAKSSNFWQKVTFFHAK